MPEKTLCPRCKTHPKVYRAYTQRRVKGVLGQAKIPFYFCEVCERTYHENEVLRTDPDEN